MRGRVVIVSWLDEWIARHLGEEAGCCHDRHGARPWKPPADAVAAPRPATATATPKTMHERQPRLPVLRGLIEGFFRLNYFFSVEQKLRHWQGRIAAAKCPRHILQFRSL